jgi:hypothetical protein
MTGVPVSLDALDSNNNWKHIGDAVTDAYTGTFGLTWKPEITGQYRVTATFLGDASYSSSTAASYVGVVEAPQKEAVTPVVTEVVDNMPVIYAVIGAAVAIIIALALAVLLIQRK